MMTAVLCWDIDGTLLSTARAGVFALVAAADEVLGVETDFRDLFTAGFTDLQVVRAAIEYCGAECDGATHEKFLRSYEQHLPSKLPLREGQVLPNVIDVLKAIDERADLHQILLTGNTRAGASAKLKHYGIYEFFEGGAFSDDTPDRQTIARRALALARERAGDQLPPDALYVIGDTPHDISCGKVIGARTVAVATSVHTREALAAHDPWISLKEIPPPGEFFELLELS